MALVPITVISIIIVVFACQRDEHQSSQSNLTSGRTLKSVNDSGPIGVVTGNGLELIESQLNMKTIFLQNYPSLKESWMQDKLSIDKIGFAVSPAGLELGNCFLTARGVENINGKETPFYAAIPLIYQDQKVFLHQRLKGMKAEVIVLNKCTGDPCSQCSFKYLKEEIIGCVCTVGGCVTPPCQCNHTREQVIIPD